MKEKEKEKRTGAQSEPDSLIQGWVIGHSELETPQEVASPQARVLQKVDHLEYKLQLSLSLFLSSPYIHTKEPQQLSDRAEGERYHSLRDCCVC